VASQPGPKVAVGQDLDDPPGLGAQFGEVNATIHKKLGCVGHITDGCPRDLDEVEGLGFQLFGLNPCVSHAYVRITSYGKPVKLAGVEIHPGDLIHADKHGVCVIPIEIAPRLAEACAEVERMERPLLEICRSANFSLEEYLRLRSEMKAKIRE
jgi:regulator of RNase E activity RraA